MIRACNLPAQHGAHRCKAFIDAAQKQHQSHVGIGKAHAHAHDLPPLIPPGKQLKHEKYHHNRQHRHRNLPGIQRDFHRKRAGYVPHGHNLCHLGRGIQSLLRCITAAQQHHGHNGPHTGQCHQTKAVPGRLLIAAHRRQPHAQRHDKRHRDRPGGNAAGVKGHRQKIFRYKKGTHNDDHIKNAQHQRQIDM